MPRTVAPQPGQIARVRSRQYLVSEVVPPPEPGQQTRVRLSCLDDDAQGQELEVLWEREVDARLAGAPTWQRVHERGFDDPQLFSSYLHAIRWNCVTSTDPRLFQAPYRAGIEVLAYQLEPLRKALQLPRVNLFIADDVGLGKTIEAGLIVRELILRQRVRRIVVAAPPSVVRQWQEELEQRFGLSFVVLDRAYVAARKRERGYGVNPWNTHSRFVVSHALLRDEDYAGSLRDWLGDFGPGALLILDEAHNAAPASGARYAIDSKFTRVVRDIAHRFEHRLFLSATPHNGHSNSFAALLEILDPQRFCRGVPVKSKKLLDAVMVRRLKKDLAEQLEGFPERKVIQVDITGLPDNTPELQLAQMLADYKTMREQRLTGATARTRAQAGLIIVSLQKRLLSSIEAVAGTLAVHRAALEKAIAKEGTQPQPGPPPPAQPEPRQLTLSSDTPGADDDQAELPEAELQAQAAGEMASATAATSRHGAREQLFRELAHANEMQRLADDSRGLPDARVRHLVEWIRKNMCPDLPTLGHARPPGAALPKWNDRRVLLFTEYIDTKRYLEQQLRAAIAHTDRADTRIAALTGGLGDDARKAIKDAFNSEPSDHPLRILIATDAAREGVNLQNQCADLFHIDVPWNPGRMEQRNGRIDRKLQRAPEVRCYYFVYRQRPEDHVLEVLVRKTKIIRDELGSLTPVVERRLESLFKGGIDRSATARLAREIEAADEADTGKATVLEELEEARERQAALARQLDGLRDLLQTAQSHLDLTEPHFRGSLDSSLGLLHAPALEPIRENGRVVAWRFPALDRRDGADPTWADTLDTLRAPRSRDQDLAQWRREAPIRPIVFQEPGTLDQKVVHLHLEHRVVQRLLGRFLSQGFVHDDLSRACIGQTQDAIARVVLLGRLSLYGPRAARLHDEIVAVAARWTPQDARKGPLKPYADEAQEKTLELLDESLGGPKTRPIAEPIRRRLEHAVEQDVHDLLPHLTSRGRERADRAKALLGQRGQREAKEMAEILASQRERIAATLNEQEKSPQLELQFDDEERRQREADRKHWQRRLVALEQEIQEEPRRIEHGYQVQAERLEPIGVVYLWPVTG